MHPFGGDITDRDVQGRHLANGFRLSRVGVTGVKKPVTVRRGNRNTVVNTTIDVFVDLPSTQKGSHLSRNLEVVSEVVDDSVREPVHGLEVLGANICRALLEKHEYASYSEVHVSGDYFTERTGPEGRKTLEHYRLLAKASSRRGDGIKKLIGVEVIGMTACPCAMETVKYRYPEFLPEEGGDGPVISHNQRNVASLMMEVPEEYDVEANDLIDLVEECFSSPTYEILKRNEEALVVLQSHRNPKFVEDVVREILARVLENYTELPDEVMVTVKSESEESIHKHNAMAERVTTLGELRSGAR
ncbi:MAG: GTP cyclohydrolase MptA [Methanomassiliicoccales archaeon]